MMRYKFPHITNLKQVEEAIKGRDEFIVAEREFGYVVNYLVNFEDTFPRLNTKDPALNALYAMRRECRGIKFDKDGEMLARTLHKFFNMGERPETEMQNVDFSEHYVILDKLDGSMVHPINYQNQVALCTKMGLTDYAAQAQTFIDGSKIGYTDFCWNLMKEGFTPTFEWCTRQNRIVVDYPNDQLVLTAIRNMTTGNYVSTFVMDTRAEDFGVPVVGQWHDTIKDISSFVDQVKDLEDEEGYVIRFNDGHMLKIKNVWYLQLHKVKELLSFEKDVWALVLDNRQDDAKAVMEPEDKARLDAFADDLNKAIAEKADELKWIVIAAKDNLNDSKKRFAIEVVPQHSSLEKGLLFSIWDGKDPVEAVHDHIRKNIGSGTKVDEIRPLVGGIKWERY